MAQDDAHREWTFKQHWLMLLGPTLLLLIGIGLHQLAHGFFDSPAGARAVADFSRAFAPILGPAGLELVLRHAHSAFVVFLLLVFVLPFVKAALLRETTLLSVTPRQILWRRGVIARDFTQIEIGEIVGVNVSETVLGRLFGYAVLDIETRGEDRLVAPFIGDARGFAGLALQLKHEHDAHFGRAG